MMMMGSWYGGLGWVGMVLSLLLSLALIIGLVFLVIWIVKRSNNNHSGRTLSNAASTAVAMAKERYANGEISREEYQKLLPDLGTG